MCLNAGITLKFMIKNFLVIGIYFFLSFLATFIAIPQTLKIFKGKKLFDAPGGRKLHKGFIPSMGGVGIFFGFIIVAISAVSATNFDGVNYLWSAMLLLFFTGLKDDLVPMSSVNKLFIQILSAAIVVGMTDLNIISLYTLGEGIYEDPLPEWFSYFFTVFFIVAFTNAFNMIDGIDGLAGSLASLLLSFLTLWFASNHFWTEAFLSVTMLGAIAGFLYYNWSPAKIFMGDTGSLVVGFFCALMMILFLNKNQYVDTESWLKIENSVAFIAAIFMYPIFDVFRVFLIRIKEKRSPFSPDKLHIHLLMSRLGLRHHQIVSVILCATFVLLFVYKILSYFGAPELSILVVLFGCSFVSNYMLKKRLKRFKKDKKQINWKEKI